jgi:signal transduction histidine kinase
MNIFSILSRQAGLAVQNCRFLREFKKTQERIFAAEKMASIGGMSEGVAHQVGNRLNQFSSAASEIKMMLEYLAKNPGGGPELSLQQFYQNLNETAASISDNVKRTDEMIKGILNFARVEGNETFFSRFSLKEAVGLTLIPLRTKHRLRDDFPLTIDLGEDDTIYGVLSQIVETIYNICDNAYEACQERRDLFPNWDEKLAYNPIIKLQLRQFPDKSVIEISDNGIGIKEGDAPKIFAPFFTTKSSYRTGTGIGVYVVRRIVEENHKGTIHFKSQYLQGTKFIIELPRK